MITSIVLNRSQPEAHTLVIVTSRAGPPKHSASYKVMLKLLHLPSWMKMIWLWPLHNFPCYSPSLDRNSILCYNHNRFLPFSLHSLYFAKSELGPDDLFGVPFQHSLHIKFLFVPKVRFKCHSVIKMLPNRGKQLLTLHYYFLCSFFQTVLLCTPAFTDWEARSLKTDPTYASCWYYLKCLVKDLLQNRC